MECRSFFLLLLPYVTHTVCKKNDEQGKDKKERRTLMRSPTLDGRTDGRTLSAEGGGGGGWKRGINLAQSDLPKKRKKRERDGTVT